MERQQSIEPVLIINLSKRFYGGVESRVTEIAKKIHGRFPYAVATIKGSLLDKRLMDAHLVTLPFSFRRWDPRFIFALFHTIRQYGFKVVDAHNTQSQLWGLLAAHLAKVPVKIATIHSVYRLADGGLKGWLFEQILKLNIRMKCHFIAVSEAVYEYLKELGTETRRISLIHNAIHLMEQNQKTIHPSFRESIGWEKNHYVVIVVGRLEPVKGHKFLIDAIRQVAPERPRLRCLVVGEGRERERLEAQVKRFHLEGIVHFTGFRDDIETLLNASDAFCMPSLSEALPYALLEACSCRLPLLVTEVGGMAKLLTHGKNAIFIKPESSDALVKGLFRLIDNPEENVILGSAAFELVQKHFSVEQMVAETMKRYGVQETVR